MENITILNLSEAELKEVSFPKPLKLSREKLEKLEEDSRKINEPVVEQPVYEEPVQGETFKQVKETPQEFVEDKSFNETPLNEEPSMVSGMLNNDGFDLNSVIETKKPVVEQPVYEEPVQETEPAIKEINNTEEKTHEWNNPGYRYKEPNPIPSYTVPYQQTSTKNQPSQADVIDKINTQKAHEIKGPEYYMGLDKSKFGKTANRILTSEVPELDKFIRLLEKLKLQLEDLKSKKETLKKEKDEVLKGQASIDDLLGKTLTLDLTAIQNATKAINGAGDVIEGLKKSVEKIKEVGETSKDTVVKIENEIKEVETNISKTEEEITNIETETNSKCAKLGEDLKAATSIDEKEELVQKQLEILKKQRDALTSSYKEPNPFDALRDKEEEPVRIGRAA